MKHCLYILTYLFSILIISCTNSDNEHHTLTLRDSLRMQGKVIEFFPDGKLKALKSIKDSAYNGSACFFNEDGELIASRYVRHNKLEGTAVDFEDSGKVKKIANWQDDRMHNYLYFDWSNFTKMHNRPVNIIAHSSPFVTIDADLDTINLGNTYNAKIILNFPKSGFNYNIYARDHTDTVFHLLNKGTEAELCETPSKIGERSIDIGVLAVNKSEIKNTKPRTYETTFTLKYFVKPK